MAVSPDVMPDPFNLNVGGHLQQVAEYDVIHTFFPPDFACTVGVFLDLSI